MVGVATSTASVGVVDTQGNWWTLANSSCSNACVFIWYAAAKSTSVDSVQFTTSVTSTYTYGFILELNGAFSNLDKSELGSGSNNPQVASFTPMTGSVVIGVAAGPTGWGQVSPFIEFGSNSWSAGAEYAANWAGSSTTVSFANMGAYTEAAASFAPITPTRVAGTAMDMHFRPSNCPSETSSPPPLTSIDTDNIINASFTNSIYVRFDIWWDYVYPNNGNTISTCALGYYSEVVAALQNQGIAPVIILGTNEPNWMTAYCGGGLYPVFEQYYLREYAGNISAYFGARLNYYQLANELDSPSPIALHELTCGSTPLQYMTAIAQGLRQGTTTSYSTIVNAYADGPIVVPTTCDPNGGWLSDLTNWVTDPVLGPLVNILAIDHYPGSYCSGYWGSDGYLTSLRNLAVTHSKSYAETETGYSTCSVTPITCVALPDQTQVSYAEQALSALYSFSKSHVGSNPPPIRRLV